MRIQFIVLFTDDEKYKSALQPTKISIVFFMVSVPLEFVITPINGRTLLHQTAQNVRKCCRATQYGPRIVKVQKHSKVFPLRVNTLKGSLCCN